MTQSLEIETICYMYASVLEARVCKDDMQSCQASVGGSLVLIDASTTANCHEASKNSNAASTASR